MKKKYLFILIGILFVGGIMFFAIHVYRNREGEAPKELDRMHGWLPGEYDAYYAREKVPTDIVWYGEFGGCEFEIPLREETKVTNETLAVREGYSKALIVVNDLGGDAGLSEEDYTLITRYVLNDERYNLIYFGKENEALVSDLMGYKSDNLPRDNRVMEFYRFGNDLCRMQGGYRAEDIEILDVCTYALFGYATAFE